MTKDGFSKRFDARLEEEFRRLGNGWEGRISFAAVAASVAEEAGLSWDPEEPEVLWESGRVRILSSGGFQLWRESETSGKYHRGEWEDFTVGGETRPVWDELARRLLEERKQQEALDEHNNELEEAPEEAEASERAAWSVMNGRQNRLDGIAINLQNIHSRLNAQARGADEFKMDVDYLHSRLTKLEQDLLLVRGQAAHVDEREAADFQAIEQHLQTILLAREARLEDLERRVAALEARPRLGTAGDLPGDRAQVAMHYEEWKRLVLIDELWGPGGGLRNKLATCRLVGLAPTQLEQLRSELLAVPPEFLFESPASAELPLEGEIRPVSAPSASRPDTPSRDGR